MCLQQIIKTLVRLTTIMPINVSYRTILKKIKNQSVISVTAQAMYLIIMMARYIIIRIIISQCRPSGLSNLCAVIMYGQDGWIYLLNFIKISKKKSTKGRDGWMEALADKSTQTRRAHAHSTA